ncbi:MAG TPA: glycerophosphodiester phosphodiesterase family protein [Sedimentisphaerales bacterium]|nr:glycerophosphodiester phosphodiesterase family protein [Sedimentisphaerales bacterium]
MMQRQFHTVRVALVCVVFSLSLWPVAIAEAASAGLHTIDVRTPQGLRELFAPGDPLPLVSAHRGGAGKGLPENCIATFEETLRHGWAMLEIDPRYTKDRVLVLHHDPTLERTTNGTGRVADRTWEELRQLRLKDLRGALTEHRMTTLDEALEWARGKTILILDNKDVPVEDLVRKIEEHHAEACAMLIVYNDRDVQRVHALNKNVMMEVMMANRLRMDAFDKLGVPWQNIIAFVGHEPPQDPGLCQAIHAKGARCMAGTSRNIDRRFLEGQVASLEPLRSDYRVLLKMGVDLIETDIPRQVAPLLYAAQPVPASKVKYFRSGPPR